MAQRKRRLVANELSEAALQLLALKGFEAVTVDEIAVTAGVSKRTFFRYFASKEDVVVQFLADLGGGIRAELAGRPAGELPSLALGHAVRSAMEVCAEGGSAGSAGSPDHAERVLRVVQLILGTPALRARFVERQAQWRDELAAELGRRLGLDPAAELYPLLAAGMAVNAFDAVLRRWSAGGGVADPVALTNQAFALLAPALDSVPASPA
ncbi:TetR family transcriptional regulator [Actinacidiphila acidipaludis]|uniref:TetR family transcriptional regulator n=1 Tax=Actinacidiphila acidipaludis TaxID=2873382 RepID=A0ABS7Q8S1_9ACTN|nr:TetR family transcriptional regulator [Streptomyces acidipaludis]MBY8879560.1 TetR family transcriptional regulator [Streptomyces acidipaludis]